MNQRRWICLERHILPNPAVVTTSLPQGDAISPMALVLLLARPTRDVASIPGIRQTVFVDDRVISAESVDTLRLGLQRWQAWSQRIGLKENLGKMKFVATKFLHNQQLSSLGLGSQIFDQIKVLGIAFKKTSHLPSIFQHERAQQAIRAAHRLCRLPVARACRMRLFRSRILSRATWGAWFEPFKSEVIKTFQKCLAAISYLQRMSSRPLFRMLSGHVFFPDILALTSSIRTLRQVQLSWRPVTRPGSWQSFVTTSLAQLGWDPVPNRAWHFRHHILGTIDISAQDGKYEDHCIRESWRRRQFLEWQQQNRRDSHLFSECVYSEPQIAAARRLFESTTGHGRAVLIGAANSTAVYTKMRKQPVSQSCPFCHAEVPPVWEHLVWHCRAPVLAEGRPEPPLDELHRRFGWPADCSRARADEILAHMSRVRACVREHM